MLPHAIFAIIFAATLSAQTQGTITTYAGNGTPLYSSDGGPATSTGIGGGGQSNILSGREAADTLTKATVVLAILFAILSIGLNIKGLRTSESEQGIIERQLEQNGQSAPSLPGGQ